MAHIKVFVTKNRKFRARIECDDPPHREITVGGFGWDSGRVRKYEGEILRKCGELISNLNDELAKQSSIICPKPPSSTQALIDMVVETTHMAAAAATYDPDPEITPSFIPKAKNPKSCDICYSTKSRGGFLGLFGKRYCDNEKCSGSK